MIHLSDKKCVACEGGVPPLEKQQVESLMRQVSKDWQTDFKKIWAEFNFKNFKESMVFINKVAHIAESEGHHPDIHIFYSKVRLELTTHAIGGLSISDFIMAAKIDQISRP